MTRIKLNGEGVCDAILSLHDPQPIGAVSDPRNMSRSSSTRSGDSRRCSTWITRSVYRPPPVKSRRKAWQHPPNDLSDGGLAVALAECSFGGTGAKIELNTDSDAVWTMFHEGPSRVIIATASPGDVLAIASKQNVEVVRLGETMRERLQVCNGANTWIDASLADLREPWSSALDKIL